MNGLPKIENNLENPFEDKIKKELWDDINSLSRSISSFRSLPNKILSNPEIFINFINSDSYEIPSIYESKLNDFQKLLLVKTVAPGKISEFVKMFVEKNLGISSQNRLFHILNLHLNTHHQMFQ